MITLQRRRWPLSQGEVVSMGVRRFSLAPMDGLIWGLTVMVWCLPAILLWGCLRSGDPALYLVLLFLLAIYASVWFGWRPGAFEVSEQGLAVIFPWGRKLTRSTELKGCRRMTRGEFKSEFGRAARVGAGGLWGGFGLLWTQRQGWVEFYISRCDDFLLVERQGKKPLLISPDDPVGMAEALSQAIRP